MKKLQKKLFLSCVFLCAMTLQSIAFADIEVVLGTPLNKNSSLELLPPQTTNPEIILSRQQFVLSYNKERRTPNWVAWKLEASNLGTLGRSNAFAVDEELKNYLNKSPNNKPAVEPTDYQGSCYDRGHQTPSADRTDTLPNNVATFVMSNMIPQTAYLNRVIWEHLEQYSRNLVKQGKKLYTIAGPIYDKDLGAIGPAKDILVPSKDFKVIFVLNADESYADINANTERITVIMPNIYQDGTYPDKNPITDCPRIDGSILDKEDWKKYTTTLEDIEKASGMVFSFSHNLTE